MPAKNRVNTCFTKACNFPRHIDGHKVPWGNGNLALALPTTSSAAMNPHFQESNGISTPLDPFSCF